MKKFINRRPKRKSVKFKPSHDFLSKAVAEYLAEGGTITKVENRKDQEYSIFINDSVSVSSDVDGFLMGTDG